MPRSVLRERLLQDQKVLIERNNLLVMLRVYMDDAGIPRMSLRAMDKEMKRLGQLITAYGWASCCIPPDPPE